MCGVCVFGDGGGVVKLSEFLFRGFKPCTDGNCCIKKPEGMHTNGGCKCLQNMSRSQLSILQSRIMAMSDVDVSSYIKQ